MQRGGRAARASVRKRGNDVARGLVLGPRARARPLRAPLVLTSRPQLCRSLFGGPGSTSAGRPRGRGLAAAALAAVAGARRHRLGRARAHRDCGGDRDEDQNV